MHRMRMAGTLLGLLILTSGCATCRTGCCPKPRCPRPCKDDCGGRLCKKEKCAVDDAGNDECKGGRLFPYRNACQDRNFSGNFLGRFGRWLTYRPLCATAECDGGPRRHPPLYSYFEPSKYNRCYEPVECGAGACRPCLFGGIFRRKKCDSCDEQCAPVRDAWTIRITLPRISFSRDCASPPTCSNNACGNQCMTLPRPIADRACENSSAGCGLGGCGLFGRRGGCGACGLRGRFGNNINNKCCSTELNVTKADPNHVPILPPNAVTDVKPGQIDKAPKPDPFGPPKMADDQLPGAKIEQ